MKADREAKLSDWDSRGGAEGISRRFEQRRATSLAGPEDSIGGGSRYESSTVETSTRSSRNVGESDGARVGRSSSNSRRAAFDSNDDDAEHTFEARMERIKQMRREAGLPDTIGATNNSSTAESSFSSRVESKSSAYDRSSPAEPRTSRFLKTASLRSEQNGFDDGAASSQSKRYESSAQTGYDDTSRGLSRSTYSSKYESSADQNGYDDTSRRAGKSSYSSKYESSALNGDEDSSSKYSFKSSRTKAGGEDDNIASYETSLNSRLTNRKRVEKPSLDGIDLGYDDDTLLKDISKKIPSSADILEKIKNMNVDFD